MFAVYLVLLIQTLITPSDEKFRADVNFQIDNHLQQIISDNQPHVNYWYLVQLSKSVEWAEDLIHKRIAQLSNQNSNSRVTCLFNAFGEHDSDNKYSISVQRLTKGDSCLQGYELITTALYELVADDRAEFVKLQEYIFGQAMTEDKLLGEYIKKATGQRIDSNLLFSQRTIRLIDFYLFINYQPNPTENAPHRQLIDDWQAKTDEKHRLSEPIDFVKLQVLVTAYHTIDRNFGKVYALLPKIKNNRNFTNTISKHVLFKRVAFSASAFGYYHTALVFYREDLLPLSFEMMDNSEYLTVLMDYSTIMFRLGNVRGALSNFQLIYSDIDLITDLRYKSSLLNNLAVSYLNAGFFDQYLSLQLEAYDLALKMNSYSYLLQILNNLYAYYKANSDWVRASFYLEKAYDIARLENRTSEIANINILLATYYRDVDNDYEKTVTQLLDVIGSLSPINNYVEYVLAMSELSNTYLEMREFQLFEKIRLQLLDVAKDRNDTQVVMETYSSLADYYFSKNRIQEALEIVDIIQRFELFDFEFRLRVQITNTLALMLINTNRIQESITLLSEISNEIISNVRSSSDVQSGTIRLENGYKRTFILLADLLIETKQTKRAIILLDNVKNLNKASFVNSSLLKSAILSEEDFLQDIQLSNRIELLRSQIAKSTSSEKLDLNNELIQLLAEQNILNNKVLNNYVQPELDIKSLQKSLGRSDQIISYSAIDSIMYLTSISKRSVDITRFTIHEETKSLALKVIRGIKEIAPDLSNLYSLFNDFLKAHINENTKRLIVVPDAFWYQIPIEILPTTPGNGPYSYGSVEYLIERHSVSYSNSISDIMSDLQSNSRSFTFRFDYFGLGVSTFEDSSSFDGNPTFAPLPYAKVEINNASEIIGNKNRSLVLLDKDAKKSSLLQMADQSRIIHIASHSEVYTSDPLFSVIQLNPQHSDGNLQDGRVYAYELFDLDLNSELLVLSSCESGGGNYIEGSGIIGLGRALKFAGAQSLILNTWLIQDRTASDLLTGFFNSIMKGKTKDQALRETKLVYLNIVNSNPAVWGSLILYGNSTPIVKKNYWLYMTFLILGLVVFYFGYRRYFR
jgi:CHAT domain-containing protein